MVDFVEQLQFHQSELQPLDPELSSSPVDKPGFGTFVSNTVERFNLTCVATVENGWEPLPPVEGFPFLQSTWLDRSFSGIGV